MAPSLKLGIVHIQQDANGAKLLCPVCGFDYVHLAQVDVAHGTLHATITRERAETCSTARGNSARGSEIVLSFWCEDGHVFEYLLEFHKGTTWLKLAVHPEKDLDAEDYRPELWRN